MDNKTNCGNQEFDVKASKAQGGDMRLEHLPEQERDKWRILGKIYVLW